MPRKLTRGATQLRALTTRSKTHTQVAVAAALGVSQQAVCAWANGNRRPRHEHRIAIEHLFGIPAGDWVDASERQALARLTAAPRVRASAGGAR